MAYYFNHAYDINKTRNRVLHLCLSTLRSLLDELKFWDSMSLSNSQIPPTSLKVDMSKSWVSTPNIIFATHNFLYGNLNDSTIDIL